MARARAQLDTAALAAAFAADGLHGTGIDHVAAAVGIAKPTLYERFGDKEELFALAVEAEVERLVERLRAAGDSLPALAGALDEHLERSPAGARLLLATARHRRSRIAARVERSLARVPATLATAIRGEDAEPLAAALWGGAHAALADGPPVRALARVLLSPTRRDERPPDDIWTA
jgi:AcrR family transcriptional regulator